LLLVMNVVVIITLVCVSLGLVTYLTGLARFCWLARRLRVRRTRNVITSLPAPVEFSARQALTGGEGGWRKPLLDAERAEGRPCSKACRHSACGVRVVANLVK